MSEAMTQATGLLGNLHALAARTDAAEQKILESAEARLTTIRERMDELRPRVMTDAVAARTYQDCVLEMGHLQSVITRARARIRS